MGRVEIPQLTFLRFIAAAGVVMFHHDPSSRLWEHANTAVSFFFVLSGFILAHVYSARPAVRPADFYVARLARILPLYWLALGLVAGYRFWRGDSNLLDAGLGLVLLQAWWPGRSQTLNTPGWSLSVEVAFYLVFPFLLPRLARVRSSWRLAAIGLAVWAANLAAHVVLGRAAEASASPALHDFTFYHPLTHLGTFTAGVVGGILFDRHRATLERLAPALMVGAAAAFLALMLLPNPIVRFHHNGLFAPLFVVFIWGLGAAPRRPLARLFARPPLVFLGDASYGIYLLQVPVALGCQALLDRLPVPSTYRFGLYLLALGGSSIVCFKWIETPLRERIKRAYARRPYIRSAETDGLARATSDT
jgi:peptidoglycan/LPS O-acetylase OafA/YrhL